MESMEEERLERRPVRFWTSLRHLLLNPWSWSQLSSMQWLFYEVTFTGSSIIISLFIVCTLLSHLIKTRRLLKV